MSSELGNEFSIAELQAQVRKCLVYNVIASVLCSNANTLLLESFTRYTRYCAFNWSIIYGCLLCLICDSLSLC